MMRLVSFVAVVAGLAFSALSKKLTAFVLKTENKLYDRLLKIVKKAAIEAFQEEKNKK